ncbi:MAG TPA: chromosome segregation protein ScpA [Clostridiales bacterium]|nr:chromosome segregation protein ScpA [Clostridiales bacterium]
MAARDGRRGGYRVRLDVFEGPLDLLLHLIKREEMDIYDIPIARITAQYLEYIEGLVVLDLDLASEFLLMAATLMDIKSRMLLPRPAPDRFLTEEDLTDPREELVVRLLEYKRYKEAAESLRARAEEAGRRHSRFGGPGGPLPLPGPEGGRAGSGALLRPAGASGPEGDAEGTGVTLADLVRGLQSVLRELEDGPAVEVGRETVTVEEKVAEMTSLLLEAGEGGLDFIGLLRRARTRLEAVVAFLALLELHRRGLVRLRQERPFGPITVWARPGLGEEKVMPA